VDTTGFGATITHLAHTATFVACRLLGVGDQLMIHFIFAMIYENVLCIAYNVVTMYVIHVSFHQMPV
jgi:hypothetical protein